LAQNPKGLAHSLTEKLQFAAKIDRNSVFLGRKAQILNRLQIIVPYISFYEFKKFQILAQNAKVQFYRKTSVYGKNWPKLRISWSKHANSRSVTHNAPINKFLRAKKFQISAQNPKGLAFSFNKKRQSAAKTDWNSVFLGRKVHISDRLRIIVPYISFKKI
jgi:hypothetical protein